MNILLDTCAFLWLTADAPELSQKAKLLFQDTGNSVYLSSVSVWEIIVKHKLGKLPLPDAVYLALPSAEMSWLRVAERVALGGHIIPEIDILRRFLRSLYNMLNLFAPKVNQGECYINTGALPELVFQQEFEVRTIFHPDFYKLLLQKAQP